MSPQRFRNLVWKHYREHGRHTLPWRKTHDPYKILVSEMMLQQTQVERVIPYYTAWIRRYPNAKILAAASLADVLRSWQGLGYNRRAKFLHAASVEIVEKYSGKIPQDAAVLESIWGIGAYTSRAVMTFAFNHDAVFIETNIRTAVIHHFYNDKDDVTDEEIAQVLKRVLPRGRAREWYSALMDYGAHLKRSGVRINARSKTYTKQAAFKGSSREIRGAILRTLSQKRSTTSALASLFPEKRAEEVAGQLERLTKEGLIQKQGAYYQLAK
jgi:A/G-specific adenine glycosylase